MLYSDAIEVVNPLGAGRGKHKVIQTFFTLCEIPKHQRSKIDRIQLVAVFKEKLIKQFGYQKIYHRLVEDLKILETGITVHQPVERVVKAGLLIHPADNLEAHGVGGYSMSFSSKDVCRFCHLQYEDLVENIHDYCGDPHLKWSVEEYDKVARSVENKKNSQAEAEMSASGDEEDDSNVVDQLGRNAEGNDEHRMDGEANSDGNESFEEAESDEEA